MNSSNSALLLIEFQYEWLHEQGKLHRLIMDKEDFQNSILKAQEALAMARKNNLRIIHSGLSFPKDYKELGNATSGLRAAIKKHQTFLENTVHSQFYEPFAPQEGEFVVTGRTGASAFTGSNLDIYLRNNNVKTLYIMGYALHVCVESSIRAAHDLGYEVILIEDASAAFNLTQKNYVLQNVIPHFGKYINTSNFINLIK